MGGAIIAWLVAGYPPVYFAASIRGRVVDADTQKPIAGTIIVAQWIAYVAGIGHGDHRLRLHIVEVVTDQNGEYTISGWGPRLRLPFSELDNLDPQLSIFKNGYYPTTLTNFRDSTAMIRVSDWDQKTISLRPFDGKLEQYADHLRILSTGLAHEDREWKAFPRMVLALYQEQERLRGMGLKPGHRATIFDVDNFKQADREFLSRFKE